MYQCAGCAKQPALYAALGHDGPPQQYWRENLLTGAPLARCPMRDLLEARDERPELFAEFQRYASTYYPAYRGGHLLVAGGVVDQPARYLDVVCAIDDLATRSELRFIELTKEQDGDLSGSSS